MKESKKELLIRFPINSLVRLKSEYSDSNLGVGKIQNLFLHDNVYWAEVDFERSDGKRETLWINVVEIERESE